MIQGGNPRVRCIAKLKNPFILIQKGKIPFLGVKTPRKGMFFFLS